MKVNAIKTQITTSIKLKYLGFGFCKSKEGYDDAIIPDELDDIHHKVVIIVRNRISWITVILLLSIPSIITEGHMRHCSMLIKRTKTLFRSNQIKVEHNF